jgi:hypothetical protein
MLLIVRSLKVLSIEGLPTWEVRPTGRPNGVERSVSEYETFDVKQG